MNRKMLADLKLRGYFQQQDEEYFSLKIVPKASNMTTNDMKKVIEIADKYGRGYFGFTTRQCIEIPWIKLDDTDEISEEIKKMKLIPGGSGRIVTTISSCKGTVCKYGLIDTQELCRRIHDKHFGRPLPGKFKIGIVGCPNNCVKAPANDLGFMGQRVPMVNEDKCKGCTLCMKECRINSLLKKEKVVEIDYNKCLNCGKCIKACPFDAMKTKDEGIAVFLGGKFGRKYRIGDHLEKLYSIEEAEQLTDKIIDYYDKNGRKLERFADYVERVGIDDIKYQLNIE